MTKRSLMGEYAPGGKVMDLKRAINGIFRTFDSSKTDSMRKTLRIGTAPSMKATGLVLASATVFLWVVIAQPVGAKVWKLGQANKVTWKHYRRSGLKELPEKRVQITLTVDGPEQTGKPGLYRLRVSDAKAFSSDSAMSPVFDKPGSIMVAVDDTKFFLGTRGLYYKADYIWPKGKAYSRRLEDEDFSQEELEMGGFKHKIPEWEPPKPYADPGGDWKEEFVKVAAGTALPPFGIFVDVMEILTKVVKLRPTFNLLTYEEQGKFILNEWQSQWMPPNVPPPFAKFYQPQPSSFFLQDRQYDTETVAWPKFEKDVDHTNREINYWFEVGRETSDEAGVLYLRLLIPYYYWAYIKGPESLSYAEIEWQVELPGKKETGLTTDAFYFLDRDDDRVNPVGFGANEKQDGHFKLKMTLPSPKEITSIRVDALGKTTGHYGSWNSAVSTNWILGVFHKGKAVHDVKTDSLGTYEGSLEFDLYGEGYSLDWFAEDDEYRVTVLFADGSSIKISSADGSPIEEAAPSTKEEIVTVHFIPGVPSSAEYSATLGQKILVQGEKFAPETTYKFKWGHFSCEGKVTTDSKGNFQGEITLPSIVPEDRAREQPLICHPLPAPGITIASQKLTIE